MKSAPRCVKAFLGLLLAGASVGTAAEAIGSDRNAVCATENEGELVDLNAQKGKELVRDCAPLILDVRTPSEYQNGHIREAKLVPLRELKKRIGELDPYRTKPVLIYCRSGNRSRQAASILKHFGFKHLFHLNQGMKDWNRSGLLVTR